MALKYYSDKTNKFYDTADEANRAEFELKEKENLEKIRKERELALEKEKKEKALAERKAAAEKVDAARKAYLEAQKAYRTELEAFCKQFGTYHYSVKDGEEIPSLFDVFGNLFRF
jgi:deoxyxylulose-5-phosphate synthase